MLIPSILAIIHPGMGQGFRSHLLALLGSLVHAYLLSRTFLSVLVVRWTTRFPVSESAGTMSCRDLEIGILSHSDLPKLEMALPRFEHNA